MEAWHDYVAAEAGASAALAGLIFGTSPPNGPQIILAKSLLSHALGALDALISVRFTATVLLKPGESLQVIRIELLSAGIVDWLAMTWVLITEAGYRRYWRGPAALAQLATHPLLVAGIGVLPNGVNGVSWIVPAVVFSCVVAALYS
jgi:hypothetical protein